MPIISSKPLFYANEVENLFETVGDQYNLQSNVHSLLGVMRKTQILQNLPLKGPFKIEIFAPLHP